MCLKLDAGLCFEHNYVDKVGGAGADCWLQGCEVWKAGSEKLITAALSEGDMTYCYRLCDKVEIVEWNKSHKWLTLRSNNSL